MNAAPKPWQLPNKIHGVLSQ